MSLEGCHHLPTHSCNSRLRLATATNQAPKELQDFKDYKSFLANIVLCRYGVNTSCMGCFHNTSVVQHLQPRLGFGTSSKANVENGFNVEIEASVALCLVSTSSVNKSGVRLFWSLPAYYIRSRKAFCSSDTLASKQFFLQNSTKPPNLGEPKAPVLFINAARPTPTQCVYVCWHHTAIDAMQHPSPLCDIPFGCCYFTGPWTVTRSSLRMLHRVAAFCLPLQPVLLLVLFVRSWSPVVGVLGLC